LNQKSEYYDKQNVCEYLSRYLVNALQRFINSKIGVWDDSEIIEALHRRNAVYLKFEGKEES